MICMLFHPNKNGTLFRERRFTTTLFNLYMLVTVKTRQYPRIISEKLLPTWSV